jgi:Trk-type K+ transport system membrane component
MQLGEIFSLVGFLLMVIGGAMLLPMGVSIFYGESSWLAFLVGGIFSLLRGWVR